ncbi:MAG TPA: hypothetical protein VFB24_05640 [Candidatus Binatia bacterium]|nr:hypothetical protein [Candidatus Binatia bacterium]
MALDKMARSVSFMLHCEKSWALVGLDISSCAADDERPDCPSVDVLSKYTSSPSPHGKSACRGGWLLLSFGSAESSFSVLNLVSYAVGHGVRLAYVVSHEVVASKAGIKTAM